MIDWENYEKRLFSIRIQCDLARKTFAVFKGTPEAIDNFVSNELQDLQSIVSEARSKKGAEGSEHWAFTKEGIETYIQGQKEYLPKRIDEVGNRINQNELILVLAVLESILKDIHREVLRQKPLLLRTDKKIELGKLIAKGISSIVDEEIEREVHGLDRQNIEDREKYFDKVLDLGWGGKPWVELAKIAFSKRNTILHENPDIEVDDFDTVIAFTLGVAIPLWCISQASIIYPEGFLKVKNWDEARVHELRKLSRCVK